MLFFGRTTNLAVPDYQSLMLPLLHLTLDRQEHSFREAIEAVAKHFSLTDSDRAELLPSGRQLKFENRLGWARTYIAKADC
jgi:restriction system protein